MNWAKNLLVAGSAVLTLGLGSPCVTQLAASKPNLEEKVEKTKDYNTSLKMHNLIRLSYVLGMPYENIIEFKNTEKPNAVLIYPFADNNQAFQVQAANSFLKKIMKSYDTWAVVAEVEKDAFEAIDKIPNIELLVLGGHGTQKSLSLGYNLDYFGLKALNFIFNLKFLNKVKEYDEKYLIDMSDKEFAQHLAKLAPNAVIFLTSCSNGKHGEEGDNLANFLKKELKKVGRDDINIISSKEDLMYNEIFLKSAYPFDARIIIDRNFRIPFTNILFQYNKGDVTYTTNSFFKKPARSKKPVQNNYNSKIL